ncbi:hypothetical protein NSMM_980040 [Nitrosomonas mobilis]|uniref:Uncharacterized protein n=1 Tax=Nitrosomonas mobilis TaxID=51642 RepID=A0A1G5SJ24_9PROT|nr:hypothetical protein NSMM_980040 [Nitrosomonas mobilis]
MLIAFNTVTAINTYSDRTLLIQNVVII